MDALNQSVSEPSRAAPLLERKTLPSSPKKTTWISIYNYTSISRKRYEKLTAEESDRVQCRFMCLPIISRKCVCCFQKLILALILYVVWCLTTPYVCILFTVGVFIQIPIQCNECNILTHHSFGGS